MRKSPPSNSRGREVTIKAAEEKPAGKEKPKIKEKLADIVSAKSSIKFRFLFFSVILFFVILAGGGIFFFLNMKQIVARDISQKLSMLIEAKASQLESSTAKEIAIAMKMADSPIIREYFLNVTDGGLETLAFKEIAGYRRAFTGNNVFWINDTDRRYYFGDEYVHTLNPADPSSTWYTSIIRNPAPYFFDVDTNIETKKTMLWINAPVMELPTGEVAAGQNRAIGVVGTGIDLTGFISALYADAAEEMPFYLFDKNNVITGASDWNVVASKSNLTNYFGGIGDELSKAAKELSDSSDLSTLRMDNIEYVVSFIPSLNWYIVALQPMKTTMILNSSMAYLFILIIIAVLVVFIIINVFIFRMVKPLNTNVKLLGEIAESWDMTRRFEVNSSDEVGNLAGILNKTFGRIRELVTIIIGRAKDLSGTGEDLSIHMLSTAGSVSEISEASQSILEKAETQTIQVQKVDQSMANIIKLVEKLGENISRQSESVSQSSSAMEQMFANISMVTTNLEKNAGNMNALEEASKINRKDLETISSEFQDITKQSEGLLEINAVIENIASQTNLLSMNAAIEAAHAGETGKGFAVVAGEIRKLAEGSSKQSKTIAEMVKKIKSAIDTITLSITKVLDRFENMDEKIKTIAEQESEIRNAMEEQESGGQQILNAIAQLKSLTGEVREDSTEIVREGRSVINDSVMLKGLTVEIESGMKEMSIGAEHINMAINQVNEITGGNKESINTLMQEVLKFKVE